MHMVHRFNNFWTISRAVVSYQDLLENEASDLADPVNKLDLIWFNQLELLAHSQPFTLKRGKKKKKQLLTFNYTVSGFERVLRGSVPFTATNTQSWMIVPDTAQHTVCNNAGFASWISDWIYDAGPDVSHSQFIQTYFKCKTSFIT